MSFEVKNFFILMKSDLSVVVCVFGVIPKKALLNPRSQGSMPTFSESFIVLVLTLGVNFYIWYEGGIQSHSFLLLFLLLIFN